MDVDPTGFDPGFTVDNDRGTIIFKLCETGPVTVTIKPDWGGIPFFSFTLTEDNSPYPLVVTADVKAGLYTIWAAKRNGGQMGMTGHIRVGGGDDKSQR
ncbi:hypothetical protein [Sorangium cellulosum]|uniref:hypothetical protein n=1 Tax=Sorangium cellulosum TaxID=56 RepID=UPI0011DDD579|nr:hypothetical protein [Sorangium cellulosum]